MQAQAGTFLQGCPGHDRTGAKTGPPNGTCVDCPAGQYTNSQSSCTGCDPCDAGFVRIDCQSSTVGTCEACVAGRFKASGKAQSSWNTTCEACQAGTYSERQEDATGTALGIAHCSDCIAGQYSSTTGQEVCKQCEPGAWRASKLGRQCCSTAGERHNGEVAFPSVERMLWDIG